MYTDDGVREQGQSGPIDIADRTSEDIGKFNGAVR